VAGLGALAAALWFDARDPERVTRLSDNAFWLHLIAAPQIIFGLRGMLDSLGMPFNAMPGALILVAVLVGVAVVSIAINRRALVVSAVLTFTASVGTILSALAGGDTSMVIVGTALIVGGSIVLLGGGWKTARRLVLSVLPKDGVFARIFPPEAA
jgi:hypothetical protein